MSCIPTIICLIQIPFYSAPHGILIPHSGQGVSITGMYYLNIWGLILIGISLFVGLYVRWASLFAAILLFFLSADMTCGLDRSPRSRRKDWLSVVVNC